MAVHQSSGINRQVLTNASYYPVSVCSVIMTTQRQLRRSVSMIMTHLWNLYLLLKEYSSIRLTADFFRARRLGVYNKTL